MAAALMQASATVWSDATFPPHCPGFTAADLSHAQCWGEEVADLCQVPPFHKAAIVERSQDQNDNVDPDYCLPTGSPAAAVHSSDLQPLRGLHCAAASSQRFTFEQLTVCSPVNVSLIEPRLLFSKDPLIM